MGLNVEVDETRLGNCCISRVCFGAACLAMERKIQRGRVLPLAPQLRQRQTNLIACFPWHLAALQNMPVQGNACGSIDKPVHDQPAPGAYSRRAVVRSRLASRFMNRLSSRPRFAWVSVDGSRLAAVTVIAEARNRRGNPWGKKSLCGELSQQIFVS